MPRSALFTLTSPPVLAGALFAVVSSGAVNAARSANMLANPGFETCSFTAWTVGGTATSGVATDGTAITGTIVANNVVNVHGGACAAWAKVANSSGIHFTLEQTVTVTPYSLYEVGFWNGLAGDTNVGRFATIAVGGATVFDGTYLGVTGTGSSDYVRVVAYYYSGPTSGPVTVKFTLKGSGTGLAGLSYDDFEFAPATNLLANPAFEACDLSGWTVGGLAASGAALDGTALTGTVIPNNVVNVRQGNCAAWAKVANSSGIHCTLEQTVSIAPNTVYRVGFWNGLGGDSNAGRFARITVGGTTIFDGTYLGVIGTSTGDYVQVAAHYTSGASGGPALVSFSLRGSGTGLAGLSYDDFEFTPLGPTSLLQAAGIEVPPIARLGGVRPNPFRSETTILYETSREGLVRLDLYDLRGARVRRLVDGRVAPGHYSVHWNGADERGQPLPAGVYFVRLATDGETGSARIVLSR